MRFACWITAAATPSEYEIPIFDSNSGYATLPQCYVIHTLPVLSCAELYFYVFIRLWVRGTGIAQSD
jgi:hypothetical protein